MGGEIERHADILNIYLLFDWCVHGSVFWVFESYLSERFGCGWNESA